MEKGQKETPDPGSASRIGEELSGCTSWELCKKHTGGKHE